ncbi:hypothetical protein T4E_2779 [Trichinella pseudospiralis]|uniref:Uncharacterized protein n=1 Tax=Trichinella pseudospiralis TaxID=6337 RepID=A0A0V0XDW2_TRIPS|nr:hypothetical protein T4E_2779 [Trichinella pseudospiralis]
MTLHPPHRSETDRACTDTWRGQPQPQRAPSHANAILIVDTWETNISGLHGHRMYGKATILPLCPQRNPKGDWESKHEAQIPKHYLH